MSGQGKTPTAVPGKPGAPEVKAPPSKGKEPVLIKEKKDAAKDAVSETKPSKASALATAPAAAPKAGAAAAAAPSAPAAAGAPKADAATAPGAAAGAAAPKAGATTAIPKMSQNAAPTSAAAVTRPDVKLATATERLAATGSVLASGAGAVAAPPAPKAKAKPKATSSTTSKAPAIVPATSTAAMPSVPASVLGMVSGKPVPAAMGYPQPTTSSVGPARSFAKAAAGYIPAATDTIPQQGPAAVAVGRAVAAGSSAPIKFGPGKPKTSIDKKYQIVFVSSEVAPFSKTGGMGEAMEGLPTAMAALGHRVMVVSPRYDQYEDAWDTSFWSSVEMANKEEPVHFFHTFKQKVDYVFCDHATFTERVDGMTGSKLYGPDWGMDYADNQARFAYFCKAALVAIQELPLGGVPYGHRCVVIANDWHSALVPMFIKAEKDKNPSKWAGTKTAFLCHNAVFQGRFEREAGLGNVFGVEKPYVDQITFNMPLRVGKQNVKVKCINTMAAGLIFSDRVITVSRTYAIECSTDPEKGVELEDLFTAGKVTGILNGVKEGVTPEEKNFVTKTMMSCGTFSPATCAVAKEQLKRDYQTANGLPNISGPLMCFIGRLDAQKGYDLLLDALIEVLEDTEMQVVIVGAGRADLVAQTRAMEKKFPNRFFYGGWMGPERYALLAGCDFTLLPSRWEPCGLVQMEAMRMGTLPIVAPTGGLKDTVEDGVNGLWTDSEMTVEAEIDEQSVASIAKALRRAAKLHVEEPAKCVEMKQAAMVAAKEFTWSNSALQYEALFTELGAVDVVDLCVDKSVTLEVDKQVC